LLESDEEAGVCYGKSNIIHADGSLAKNFGWERFAELLKGAPSGQVWSRLIAFGALGRPSTITVRDEAARVCRYDSLLRYFEDLDYLAQIATLPRFSRFIAYDGIVGSYRFHANQAADRIDASELSMVRYTTNQTIALRVFHRLREQGRGVPTGARRKLWRLLVLRAVLRAVQANEWSSLARLHMDLLMPIGRLEKRYWSATTSGRLEELMGVWQHTAAPVG
jgi:hypothetical protein